MWISTVNVAGKSPYEVHQAVYAPFTERVELYGRDFCYRANGGWATVYSQNQPFANSVCIEFSKNQMLEFSLVCSPGRGTYRDESGKRHRMTPRRNLDDVFAWLERRLKDAAVVHTVSGKRLGIKRIERPSGKVMSFPTWLLQGEIEVLRPRSFEDVITLGLGQGSGFGLGQIVIEGNA